MRLALYSSLLASRPARRAAVAAVLTCAASLAHAAGMSVSSTAFTDGATFPALYAGPGQCGGQGQSLPLSWQNLPAGTRSLAITLVDPDGAKGAGVNHWVVYNVDAARGALLAGDGLKDIPGVSVGKNSAGALAYRGPCPPVGDVPHHYILTVTALDLAPGALPAGLDRAGLLAAIQGHTINGASMVGRYGR